MQLDPQKPARGHDVFISYSRVDKQFAIHLEKALENYKPPKDLSVPQRHLDVFRDEEDFTGVEYHQSLGRHLKSSTKLIVICSPSARRSSYVNDEIRLFTSTKGAENIIPILVSGIPNNAATPEQKDNMAFPEALCEALVMPLATSYVAFDPQRDKITKGVFYGSWYTVLANIYGLKRSEIEQRDKRRLTRSRRITTALVSGIVSALSIALLFALLSRQQAVKAREAETEQRKVAVEQKELADKARLAEEDQRKEAESQRDRAEKALLGEKEARAAEEVQRTNAEKATVEANRERDNALQASNLAEERLYASNMNLAQREYEDRDFERMSRRLDFYLPTLGKSKSNHFRGFEWYHLWHLSDKEPKTLNGISNYLAEMAFSPDGKILAVCGHDAVLLLDASSQLEIGRLKTDRDIPRTVAFSPDGNMLVTSSGLFAKIWDTRTQQEKQTFPLNKPYSGSAMFSPDGKLLAIEDGEIIRLWETQAWQELKPLPFLSRSLAFSPDGKLLAAGTLGSVRLVDTRNWEELPPLKIHGERWNLAAFSPHGNLLAVTDQKNVSFWDTTTWKEMKEPKFSSSGIVTLAFSPDGKTLVTAGGHDDGGDTYLWDAKTGEELARLVAHDTYVISVAFSPGGKILATASEDQTIKLWDISWRQNQLPLPHSDLVTSVTFSPDNTKLATASRDTTVKVWDTTSQKELKTLTGHTESILTIAFSPDGKLLASGGVDTIVKLWNTSTWQNEKALPNSSAVSSMAFSPDGKVLAVCCSTTGLKLWSTETWNELPGLKGAARGAVEALAISRNGQLVTAGDSLRLWDLKTGQQLAILSNSSYRDPTFSQDGKMLAASHEGITTLWDVNTRRQIGDLYATAVSLSFSLDGKTLAVSSNYTVTFWSIHSRQELAIIRPGPYRYSVRSVTFSGDGRMLAFAYQKTARLWYTATNPEVEAQLKLKNDGKSDGGRLK